MEGYTMRQGTCYRQKSTGEELLFFHHDPMNLRSFALRRKEGVWDTASPAMVTADTLIAMRNSEDFEDMGDLAKEEYTPLVRALADLKGMPETEKKLLESLLN